MNNLVSIITPNYNTEKFISKTIESVINQTYKNWEMIIVDDVSTDNGVSLIQSFIKKNNRIKFYQLEKNSGASVARNKAISLASGNFIAFLDSDDLWFPNKLELQLSFMLENNYTITYTSYKIIEEDGTDAKKIINCKEKLDYNRMLYSNEIGCLTAIYNANVLGKIYMPNLRKRQDYGLWLKILKKEKYAFGLKEVLACYRNQTSSISQNKIEMLKWNYKLYRTIEKLPFYKAIYYTTCNIVNKFLK